MHTLYIRPIGEITLHLDSMYVQGIYLYISGYDTRNNCILFAMNKFSCLDDYLTGYGYCNIAFYIKNNIKTPCNLYVSLS